MMKNNPLLFWLIIGLLFFGFIYLISPILLPFVVGLGLAYILDPVADRLEAKGCSRNLATTIVCGGVLTLFTLIIILFVPMLFEQIGYFFNQLPEYAENIKEYAYPYMQQWGIDLELDDRQSMTEYAAELASQSKEVAVGVLRGVLQSSLAFINFMALLVITPVVSFYLLRDWDVLVEEVNELLPRDYADTIKEQLANVDRTLSAFLRGQLNVMLALTLFYGVALTLAGLSYGLIVALVAGVLVIIPYVGTFVSGALAVGLAYVQFDDLYRVGIVFGIFVTGQMLEGYVLTPRLIGKSVGLNPIWIIFGMMAGGAVMGFVGILIAVPLTAVIGVLIRFAVSQYQQSEYYCKQRNIVLPNNNNRSK